MASIIEMRKKIKGISSTRQITNAMKKVAGARFARAQRELTEAAAFAREVDTLLHTFLSSASLNPSHTPFLKGEQPPAHRRIGLIAVAGDKGLCGDFNTSIVKACKEFIRQADGSVARLFIIGNKIRTLQQYQPGLPCSCYENIFRALEFHNADHIGQDIIKFFIENSLNEVTVIYHAHSTGAKHRVVQETLLPLSVAGHEPLRQDVEIEPVEHLYVFSQLLPLSLKGKIFHLLHNSNTAELVARMRAMDNATRNANELIDDLTLEMNKLRQASITRELSEITGTSEVMKE